MLKNPKKVLENNFILQKNSISIAEKQSNLKKFIFFSTSEVYAGSNYFFKTKIPASEKTPLTVSSLESSRSTYMLSKIYGEAMCYSSKLPFLILRPHNVYGERMGMDHVIPEILKKITISKKSQNLKVFTPSHSRSFCYIDDAIKQIVNLSISNKVKQVFNIGNDKDEISIRDVVKLCLKILKKKRKIQSLSGHHNSPPRRCPNMKKTFKNIKRIKFTTLSQGIENVYNWYKFNKLI